MKSKTNDHGEKLRESVRVAKCEVDSVGGDWTETTKRWHSLARTCQRAANWYYETWLVWHINNQSAAKIEAWLNQREQVKKSSAGLPAAEAKAALYAVGKCPVAVMPKELGASIYQTLTRGLPDLTAHCMTVLINQFLGCLNGKAAHGVLPRWMASLLHHQRIPSFTDELPIPFGNQDCKLVKDGDEFFIEAKLWRMPVEGKKTSVCICDRIKLRTTGKSHRNARAMLEKIFSGEWPFKGSQLVFESKKRKWHVNVCHQRTSHVATIEPGKTAYLMPGHKNAFSLFFHNGTKWRRVWLQGRGQHITGTRERLWRLRAECNANYRHATARKGRGVNNAGKWRSKSAQTWRYFVRRVNHSVSHDAIEWCRVNGYSKLIYKQPEGRYATSRMVSGDYKNSTWEFFQLGTMLAYKGQDQGVDVVVQKIGASGDVPPKTPGPLAATKDKDATAVAARKRGGGRSVAKQTTGGK